MCVCLFIKKSSSNCKINMLPFLNDEFLKPHVHSAFQLKCFELSTTNGGWCCCLSLLFPPLPTGRISLFVVLIKQRDKIIYMKRWHLKLILLKADILISFRKLFADKCVATKKRQQLQVMRGVLFCEKITQL